MATNFNIGDLVETIDDNIKGKVTSIEVKHVKIITDDGFEMNFKPDELIKVPDETISIKNDELKKVIQQEMYLPKKSKSTKEKPQHKVEIDLHIHELIDDARRLSNYQILNIQLDKAKQQLDWAMRKKIRQVVFIHGVGQGVLRAELHTLFRRYDNVEFYDADYSTYGVGATKVSIY